MSVCCVSVYCVPVSACGLCIHMQMPTEARSIASPGLAIVGGFELPVWVLGSKLESFERWVRRVLNCLAISPAPSFFLCFLTTPFSLSLPQPAQPKCQHPTSEEHIYYTCIKDSLLIADHSIWVHSWCWAFWVLINVDKCACLWYMCHLSGYIHMSHGSHRADWYPLYSACCSSLACSMGLKRHRDQGNPYQRKHSAGCGGTCR